MKKILMFALFLAAFLFFVPNAYAKGGFDQYGYNDTARNFVGTGFSWCQAKVEDGEWDMAGCTSYLGASIDDKIVMKWNEAWDNCNEYGTPTACAGAWTNNEWNGMNGGSDSVWHYKIVWVGPCGNYGDPVDGGGYCIWGQYSVLMDQGTLPGEGHVWFAPHAIPAGYGAYK